MTWVAWRQQRTETLIAVVIVVLIAALLVPTGLEMASTYRDDGLAACVAQTPSPACGGALDSFISRFNGLGDLLAWLTLLPGLIGAMLAAPFVLAFEHGTYRLDWTQSITRRRWITGKLGLAVGAAVVFALIDIAMVTWWRTPLVHLNGRMENSTFDGEGVVAVGYTLFALGLALAIGVVWRRAVPAIVGAFAGYFALRLFVDTWLRQRLTPPATITWHASGRQPAVLNHAWVISMGPGSKPGQLGAAPTALCGPAAKPCTPHLPAFLNAVYEPASRFWSMQFTEFALFAGMAIVLIAFAAWWTSARTS